MSGFTGVVEAIAKDLLSRLAKRQHTRVLMIDQSKVNACLETLKVSVLCQSIFIFGLKKGLR